MKIISQVDISDWSYPYSCKKCDSELEVYGTDLKYQHYSGYGRDDDYEEYFTNCIVCGDKFIISCLDIPKLLQLEIKKRGAK